VPTFGTVAPSNGLEDVMRAFQICGSIAVVVIDSVERPREN
jgi:hypothetical protein